ncbi:MAG: DNA-3-methyladenine glycosylase 2 family protein [Syntrophomonadaceae bacterium]|nr:DNA-3-methyladenine glycosylase 2 family protein [Syntrophomonadaceae bacterium]
MYFAYGAKETEYLISRDKKLGEAIRRIGHIDRLTDEDLFSSVVHHIIGQQISTAAQATLWKRLISSVGAVDAPGLLALGRNELQAIGITFRKAEHILDFAAKVDEGAFALEALAAMPDELVIKELCALKGIGVWTAEMIMIFGMRRPDIVSFGDLAIMRGMRMLYRHREIDRARFEQYRKRYTPYGTVASLYLWAIAGGALPELTDPAPKRGKGSKA